MTGPTRRAALLGGLGAALAASGCGSAGSTPTSADGVRVPHRFGTAVVPPDPQRVVALGAGDLETAVALGVAPVAGSDVFGLRELRPWVRAAWPGGPEPVFLDWQDLSVEEVAALRPDLVLRTSATADRRVHELLARVAPVVGPPVGSTGDFGTAWREQTALVARALGREDTGRRVVAGVEERLASARVAHPELRGATVSVATVRPDQVYLLPDADPRARLLGELGLEVAPAVARPAGGYLVPLSPERLDLLEADVVMVAGRGADGTVDPVLLRGGVFARLAAAREGRVVLTPGAASLTATSADGDFASAFAVGGPLGTAACLDRLVAGLAAGLAGRGWRSS